MPRNMCMSPLSSLPVYQHDIFFSLISSIALNARAGLALTCAVSIPARCPAGWHVPREFGLCNNHKCGTFSDDTRLRMLYNLAKDPISLDLNEGDKLVLR